MGEEVRIYYDVEAINVENVKSFFIDDELLLIEQGMSFSFQVTAWTQETGTRFSQGGKGALHQSQVRIKDHL